MLAAPWSFTALFTVTGAILAVALVVRADVSPWFAAAAFLGELLLGIMVDVVRARRDSVPIR
jgi:hypothetical protein